MAKEALIEVVITKGILGTPLVTVEGDATDLHDREVALYHIEPTAYIEWQAQPSQSISLAARRSDRAVL